MVFRMTSTSDQATVVLKTTMHPFWHAWLDGMPIALHANENFQIQTQIPRAGAHVLELHWQHPKRLWVWISLASALGLAMTWLAAGSARSTRSIG
jgi:hypothetical protein